MLVASGLPPEIALYHRKVDPLAPGVPERLAVPAAHIVAPVPVGAPGTGFT